jgi:hypothetical protein
MIPFWCLMPKGEKLRPKQMDQLPLENFEKIVELELLICQNTLIVSYCQKLVSCGENLNKKQFLFSIALTLHFYLLLLMCWHKSPKRGRLKRKCALRPFLVYFGD